MAVKHIMFNRSLPHAAELASALNACDEALRRINKVHGAMSFMRDLVGDQPTNVGEYLATQYGFGLPTGSNVGVAGDVAIAQAAYAELSSLHAQMNNAAAAIEQAMKMFG